MAEYWKSLPKKYCEACKCWFADNKSSIEFHERGKRHQENVAKRISDIRKRGQKEYEARLKYESDMKKIEEAALKAFHKDVKNDPKLAGQLDAIKKEPDTHNNQQCSSSLAPTLVSPTHEIKREPAAGKQSSCRLKGTNNNTGGSTPRKWYEAKSSEGHSYYYNSETGQTQWEVPAGGYVPVGSRAQVKREKGGNDSSASCGSFGPQPRHGPYGQWAPVVETKKETVDLQLPTKRGQRVEPNVTLYPEEVQCEFREKTVTTVIDDDGGNVQFKKRKRLVDCKRNVRSRTDD